MSKRSASHAERAQAQARLRLRQLEQAEQPPLGLLEFARTFWNVLEPGVEFTEGWAIAAICEHLEACARGQIKKLIINVPPGHMKSLLCNVFYPAWEWTLDPRLRWLFTSYNIQLSTRDSVKMRRLITSTEYKARYGHLYQLTGDQNAKTRYDNTARGTRIVVPLTSSVGERAHRLVIDDANNPNDVWSATSRERTNGAYDSSLATRAADPIAYVQIVVQQRVHEQDLTGHLLERGGWEHLCLPAEFEPTRKCITKIWSDPRTEDGELLWEKRFPKPVIDDLKITLGGYGAAGQLQQRPAPPEGGMVKRHWWRYWTPTGTNPAPVRVRVNDEHLEIDCKFLPEKFEVLIQSWDLAFKDTTASAYVVGQVWGVLGANRYLIDQIRAKLDMVGTIAAIRALTARYPLATAKIIEDRANGPAVISMLKTEIQGLIAWSPGNDSKEARVAAVSPQIEAGNVFIPHPTAATWVNDFLAEFSSFPASTYKDQVDAAAQALLRLRNHNSGTIGDLDKYKTGSRRM